MFSEYSLLLFSHSWLRAFLSQNVEWVEIPMNNNNFNISSAIFSNFFVVRVEVSRELMQCKVGLAQNFQTKYFQVCYSLIFGGFPKLHWVFKYCLTTLGFLISTPNFSSLKYNWYRKVTHANSERQVKHIPQEIQQLPKDLH